MNEGMKATNPTQLRKDAWGYALRRTARGFLRDECVDTAGALTFFAALAVFPAGLAMMALIGIVGDTATVRERLLPLVNQVAPEAVSATVEVILGDITGAATADLTLAISVAVALWSASIYVSAFGRAVNRIYGVEEGRPYWKRKPFQLALTVLLLGLVIVIVAIVVLSGPMLYALGDLFGIGGTVLDAWRFVRWPVLAAALVVVIAVLYKGTGNVKLPRFQWLGLGAVLAIVVMGIASFGFGFYVRNIADYNQTFSTFASVIVFLVWLFLINLALLLGVEFNAETERARQLQAGMEASEDLQLPRRDTTQSERNRHADRVTHERGELLRSGHPLPPRPDSAIGRLGHGARQLWRRIIRSLSRKASGDGSGNENRDGSGKENRGGNTND